MLVSLSMTIQFSVCMSLKRRIYTYHKVIDIERHQKLISICVYVNACALFRLGVYHNQCWLISQAKRFKFLFLLREDGEIEDKIFT